MPSRSPMSPTLVHKSAHISARCMSRSGSPCSQGTCQHSGVENYRCGTHTLAVFKYERNASHRFSHVSVHALTRKRMRTSTQSMFTCWCQRQCQLSISAGSQSQQPVCYRAEFLEIHLPIAIGVSLQGTSSSAIQHLCWVEPTSSTMRATSASDT